MLPDRALFDEDVRGIAASVKAALVDLPVRHPAAGSDRVEVRVPQPHYAISVSREKPSLVLPVALGELALGRATAVYDHWASVVIRARARSGDMRPGQTSRSERHEAFANAE